MQIIKNIRIKYYRSILNTTRSSITKLYTRDLNIIVGSNDAGKSNYLKALNLFFNGESDTGIAFNFWRDFSYQRHGKRKEKNEFFIELTISSPKKPRSFYPKGDVIWTKTWKGGHFVEENIVYESGAEFNQSGKNGHYKWLKKLKYKYIPAVKSKKYFDNLMFELYDVFQKDTEYLESEFNKQVRDRTTELTTQLNRILKLDSVLQFKGTFKDLFNKFEFGSSDGGLMLNQRGDGIKIRHIPIILQCVAEEELKENRKREPIANTIWGFEEPENNLEFTSARDLANTLIEYTHRIHFGGESLGRYDEGIQIFITTHSPVFYTLGKQYPERTQTFLVKKSSNEESIIKPVNKNESDIIEEAMQLIPLVSLSNEWQKINEALIENKKIKDELEKIKNSISSHKGFIFFTEDENMALAETLVRANGFNEENVEIKSYKTCSNIASISVLYDFMQERFKEDCPRLIVHRDRDYLSEEEIEKEKANFKKIGIPLFITRGTDIESYFISEKHLIHCYPELSNTEIQQLISKAIQEKKQNSLDKYLKKNLGPKYKNNTTVAKALLIKNFNEKKNELFHGKEVKKAIASLIHKKLGKNLNINKISEGIYDDNLQQIAFDLEISIAK